MRGEFAGALWDSVIRHHSCVHSVKQAQEAWQKLLCANTAADTLPADACDGCKGNHDRHKHGGDVVSEGLDGRLAHLRSFHQLYNLRQGCVLADPGGSHLHMAQLLT